MSGKTIQINPEYLALHGRGSKKYRTQKRGRKQKPIAPKQSNKMRRELLGRIKEFQKKKEEETSEVPRKKTSADLENESNEFHHEFNRSLSFLQDLATRKRRHKKRGSTIKHGGGNPSKVAIDLPPEMMEVRTAVSKKNSPHTPSPQAPIVIPKEAIGPQITTPKPTEPPLVPKEAPPYGALKRGTRPTFREWKRMTQKERTPDPTPLIHIEDKPKEILSDRQEKLKQLKAKTKMGGKKASRIKTVKYRLGKLPDKVAVLIKDCQTRKRVQHEHGALKTQTILEVKNYLRGKNLLKSGSNAPNDVLRQLYEQSILAGDVENTGKETLMHNFFYES